jgi:Ni2+-binding GTPase involved in maturation of urease and hydrogenase
MQFRPRDIRIGGALLGGVEFAKSSRMLFPERKVQYCNCKTGSILFASRSDITEGDDKPIKYPHIFRGSQLMLLNKIDLLPYVQFDVGRCLEYVRQVNPAIKVLEVSALRGDGLGDWFDWLREQVAQRAQHA